MKRPNAMTFRYRGVMVERRYKGYEVRHGLTISQYEWVAQAPGWIAMAPSREAIQHAIDSHLDGADSRHTIACLGD